MTWQSLPEDERQAWHLKARVALAEHRRKFPKYTFRPTQSKAKSKGGGEGKPEGSKRKVREVEPKDLKRCAKIAELLVEGKKGAELDAAIQEFDKHHVPEIVTRFEAPITARAFRRSSSAPIPETENSKKSQSFLPASPVFKPKDGKRKIPRLMTSIQPTRCSTPKDGELDQAVSGSLKQEPSMDFSAFSFTHMTSGFECNPMSPVTPIQPPSLSLQINDRYSSPAPLTIPNMPSFLMDDWSQSPSPISQYAPSDAFGNLSPVDAFDAHFTFDTHAFESLNLDHQHSTEAFPINGATSHLPSLDDLSLGHPKYDLSAGAEFNLLNVDMGNLVPGFEATHYLDMLGQSPCSQQQHQYQHQHQPTFLPPHHFRLPPDQPHPHPHHMPANLDLDLTAMIGSPAEFAL
ncbi:hypothetical protein AX14_001943 [Amanita brunnescens Koide BX004]|nr:hypothetical protein AX14_001943 [Amanita brunnescens Koide BX004]